MSILNTIGSRVATPQTEPVFGKPMVPNNAGGFAFEVGGDGYEGDFARLRRFLVLGVDAGTYYASPKRLAIENAGVVMRCLNASPKLTVDIICEISEAGRAPKNDPALFAIAMACAHPKAKAYALSRFQDVARTATHLFHFTQFVEGQRGWGRGLRDAVAHWYERDVNAVAYQMVKYRQRDGWTHRDLLRLSHPKAPTAAHKALFDFACGREDGEVPLIVEGYLKARDASAEQIVDLITEYRLPWETIDSEHLKNPNVWAALLDANALPLGALIRNLGVLSARGVLTPTSTYTKLVTDRLVDVEKLKSARIHPVAVLNALLTYKKGLSKGGLTWSVTSAVIDGLDSAFYAAFGAVEPANKRTAVAIDVSDSMTWDPVSDAAFNSREGAVAMAMVTAATEPVTVPLAFSGGIVPMDLSPRRRLDDQIAEVRKYPASHTDCALPMLWAMENKVEIDTFVIYTDHETNTRSMHPFQALKQYRDKMGINARLVVAAMTSTGFSIADPSDAGSMDVVGFDTSAPQIIADFSAGRF